MKGDTKYCIEQGGERTNSPPLPVSHFPPDGCGQAGQSLHLLRGVVVKVDVHVLVTPALEVGEDCAGWVGGGRREEGGGRRVGRGRRGKGSKVDLHVCVYMGEGGAKWMYCQGYAPKPDTHNPPILFPLTPHPLTLPPHLA